MLGSDKQTNGQIDTLAYQLICREINRNIDGLD